MPTATEATTGRNVAVVAVLLVSSVRKRIETVTRITTTTTGNPCHAAVHEPSQAARPVLSTISAILSPPPRSTRTPNGRSRKSRPERTNSPRRQSTGMRNKATPAAMAMPASDKLGIHGLSNGWPNQAAAARVNTTATEISPRVHRPNFAASARTTAERPGTSRRRSVRHARTRTAWVRTRPATTNGTPTSIHWPKPIL